METVFDNFTEVGKQVYPGLINMRMVTPDDTIEVKIRLSGFSTDKIDDFSLRIPSKYTRSL